MVAGLKADIILIDEVCEAFFFPKHVPPVTITAKSREEAEEKLAALDNHQ